MEMGLGGSGSGSGLKRLLLLLFLSAVGVGACICLNTHQLRLQRESLIWPRRMFESYEEYIKLQVKKTKNPRLREVWTTRDWKRKVDVFSAVFGELKEEGLVRKESKALCIAARVGQEVVALKQIGVRDSIGIDLVPYPPLVMEGDMHSHPFPDNTFDFEFSNAFDHALYPSLFVSEIERTLKPGGVAVVHVSANRRGDKYSVNDLYSPAPFIALFNTSTVGVVHVRKVDCFGLDTQIVLRKNNASMFQTPTIS